MITEARLLEVEEVATEFDLVDSFDALLLVDEVRRLNGLLRDVERLASKLAVNVERKRRPIAPRRRKRFSRNTRHGAPSR